MKKAKRTANPAVAVRQFGFVPANDEQKQVTQLIRDNDITMITGEWGTGKSHVALGTAAELVIQGKYKKVVIVRPLVDAGEQLGFLKGDLDEKLDPWLAPFKDCLASMTFQDPTEFIEDFCEVSPLSYMRGRAEPLSNILPTPEGHRRMGDIRPGDQVYGSDGRATLVTGVFPQGKCDVFRVSFTDGTSVLCSADHLWNTRTRSENSNGRGFTTKTTRDIATSVKCAHANNHEIPIVAAPVEIRSRTVPLDPYVLGALIGDGCFSTNASVTLTNTDADILSEVARRLPSGVRLAPASSNQYRLAGAERINPVRSALRELGLWGKKSWEKSVPESYMWNNLAVRLDVLRGLFDTDGSCNRHRTGKSRTQFGTTSPELAKNVVWMVQSIGGVAHVRERKYTEQDTHTLRGRSVHHRRPAYIVDVVPPAGVPLFHCERKRRAAGNPPRAKRFIKSVVAEGVAECQCISVAAADRLYLTQSFAVTHNTFARCVVILDEAQNATLKQLKLFVTRLGTKGKLILVGDDGQSDLPVPSRFGDLMRCLDGTTATDQDGRAYSIAGYQMTKQCRHPLIEEMSKKLASLK